MKGFLTLVAATLALACGEPGATAPRMAEAPEAPEQLVLADSESLTVPGVTMSYALADSESLTVLGVTMSNVLSERGEGRCGDAGLSNDCRYFTVESVPSSPAGRYRFEWTITPRFGQAVSKAFNFRTTRTKPRSVYGFPPLTEVTLSVTRETGTPGAWHVADDTTVTLTTLGCPAGTDADQFVGLAFNKCIAPEAELTCAEFSEAVQGRTPAAYRGACHDLAVGEPEAYGTSYTHFSLDGTTPGVTRLRLSSWLGRLAYGDTTWVFVEGRGYFENGDLRDHYRIDAPNAEQVISVCGHQNDYGEPCGTDDPLWVDIRWPADSVNQVFGYEDVRVEVPNSHYEYMIGTDIVRVQIPSAVLLDETEIGTAVNIRQTMDRQLSGNIEQTFVLSYSYNHPLDTDYCNPGYVFTANGHQSGQDLCAWPRYQP